MYWYNLVPIFALITRLTFVSNSDPSVNLNDAGNSKRRLKILVNSPFLAFSHMQFQSKIAETLVHAGHEVVRSGIF